MSRTPTQSPVSAGPQVQRAIRTTPSFPGQGPDDRKPQEDKIRIRAYLLAEAAGFPTGRADEFWIQAERDIRSGSR